MPTKRIIEDPDFGKIIISSRRGARNITLRTKPDGLHATVPPYTTIRDTLNAVGHFRQQLLESFKAAEPRKIDASYSISTPCFKLRLEPGMKKNFTLRYDESETVLMYPPGTDFSRKEVQALIHNGILRAMKRKAAIMLPPIVDFFASRHALKYRKVKINGAKSRWGSCSAAGSINLSCYLILLPPHLSDYVILHELAHTVEMNHGPNFWAKLDSMTGGMALALRKELRNFKLPDF